MAKLLTGLVLFCSLCCWTNAQEYKYYSYTGNIECTASSEPFSPTTTAEVQTIVRNAIQNNQKVKAVGSLHSVTDVICTDGILINMTGVDHFRYDPETQTATVGAGIKAMPFLEQLHDLGRGVPTAPTYGGVTIGGGLSMGIYGTGLKHETSLSDMIVSMTLVDGLGNLRTITQDEDTDLFNAARVGLGLLGVIVEVTFVTVPQYKLHIHNYPSSDEILSNGKILELANTTDKLQFLWFPTNKAVVVSEGTKVSLEADGECQSHLEAEGPQILSDTMAVALESLQMTEDHLGMFILQTFAMMGMYAWTPGRTPLYTLPDDETPCLPEATGYSHRMMANQCKECFWWTSEYLKIDEGNVIIPFTELEAAIGTMRQIFEESTAQFPVIGMYFRFLSKSDGYMALNNGEEMVSIDWVSVPRFMTYDTPKLGLATIQAMGQALIDRHRGRPHWAKNGPLYSNPDMIRQTHPQLQNFVNVMNQFDPNEVFINDFGRRLKHGTWDSSHREDLTKHCALNEVCICQNDTDCGNGGMLALECGKILDYNVCKRRSNSLYQLKTNATMLLVDYMADIVLQLSSAGTNLVKDVASPLWRYVEEHPVLNKIYSLDQFK